MLEGYLVTASNITFRHGRKMSLVMEINIHIIQNNERNTEKNVH